MVGDHPTSWTNVVGKGRMFYTGMGHTDETFTDSNAMPHIMASIEWAGRF
jgi:type 1 glutamine amidotransferase